MLLIAAESARTMARRGTFRAYSRGPTESARQSARCSICGALRHLLVLASSSKNFVSVYVLITLVSTLLSLVFTSSARQPRLSCASRGKAAIIVLIGMLYSLAMFVGAGTGLCSWSLILGAAGLPVRSISRWLNGSSRAAEVNPAAPRE